MIGDSEPSKPIATPTKPYSNPITGQKTNFPPAPPTAAEQAAAAPVAAYEGKKFIVFNKYYLILNYLVLLIYFL